MKNYDISDEQLASLMEDGMWDMQYDSAPDALCLDDVEECLLLAVPCRCFLKKMWQTCLIG